MSQPAALHNEQQVGTVKRELPARDGPERRRKPADPPPPCPEERETLSDKKDAEGKTKDREKGPSTDAPPAPDAEAPPKKGRKQRYRGVYMCGKKWKVQIQYAGKQRYLGSYADQKTAALVYDDAARTLHGTSAITNFERPTPSTSRQATAAPGQKWSPTLASNQHAPKAAANNVTSSPLDTLVAVASVAPPSPQEPRRGKVSNPFATSAAVEVASPSMRRAPRGPLPHDSLPHVVRGGPQMPLAGMSPRQTRVVARKEMEAEALAAAHAQIEAEAVARYEQAKLELAAIRRRGYNLESFDNLTALASLPSSANGHGPSPVCSPHPYSFSNPRLSGQMSSRDGSGVLSEWSPLTPFSDQILSNGGTPQSSPRSHEGLVPVDVDRRSPRAFNQIPQESLHPEIRFQHLPTMPGMSFGKMNFPYPHQGPDGLREGELARRSPERFPTRLLPHGDVGNQRPPDRVPAGSSVMGPMGSRVNVIRQAHHEDASPSPRRASYLGSGLQASPLSFAQEQHAHADAASNLYSGSYMDFMRKRKADPEAGRLGSDHARKRLARAMEQGPYA